MSEKEEARPTPPATAAGRRMLEYPLLNSVANTTVGEWRRMILAVEAEAAVEPAFNVERLSQAIANAIRFEDTKRDGFYHVSERIAAEYARLSDPSNG